MEKKWYADGRMKGWKYFTQEDLSAYLRDAENWGWQTLDLTLTQIVELPDSIGQLGE